MRSEAIDESRSASPVPWQPGQLRLFFDEHFDFVWRVLARHGIPNADLDDAAQHVFMIVSNKGPSAFQPGSERAFLFGVAYKTSQYFRRTQVRRREVPADALDYADSPLPAPDVLADQSRAREVLDRILDLMVEDVRSVFVLHQLEQMTMAEIAGILAIPPGTVASRLRRAREIFDESVERFAAQGVYR